MMTANIGQLVNQSTTGSPRDCDIQANSPDTGFISMFFQTSALTVGITKKGAITRRRTMFWPKIGWSISNATPMPPTTLMISDQKTSTSVLIRAPVKAGSDKKSV